MTTLWEKKKITSKQIGEAETQSCHKSLPQSDDPQLGGNTKRGASPWGVKISKPTLGPSTFRT